MRIITGEYKGRRLIMPEGNDIRPTTEKVKEAIFSTIQSYIYDGIVVDLFSGTGNLGLEALSRGASRCYFCDNSRASLNIIKQNIEMCRAAEKSVILAGDFEKNLMRLKEKGVKADIFFLDPPYEAGYYDQCFKLIRELELLNEDGIILAEHNFRDTFPEEYEGFSKLKDKVFGTICFTIYY